MATRGQDEAERELGDLFELFRQAIGAGNRHFWTTYKADAHRITSITRAGLIRCFIADELKKLLDGRPHVHIDERHQTTHFCLGQNWLLQVHRLDEGNRSAVNMTQRSLDLNDNDLNAVELPEIPPTATVIFLGYIENIADYSAPEMRLTCPNGDTPIWAIDLGAARLPPIPVEITPPEGPQGPADGTKIVVRDKGRKFSH